MLRFIFVSLIVIGLAFTIVYGVPENARIHKNNCRKAACVLACCLCMHQVMKHYSKVLYHNSILTGAKYYAELMQP